MSAYTVAELLRKTRTTMPQNPDGIAVVAEDRTISYAELDARTDRLAAALRTDGFVHGERVGMLMRNRVEWLELFFAVGKLGGVVVPLNHLLRPVEIAEILDDCGATWVVFDPEFEATAAHVTGGRRLLGSIPGSTDVPHLAQLVEAGSPRSAGAPGPSAAAEDLLLLQYTSGTTGRPKGAMHTHSTVLWNSYHQIPDYGLTSADTWLVVPALCWAAGLHDLTLAALWAGGKVVLGPTGGFEPAHLLKTIEAERVTATLLVPTVLKRVLAEPEFDAHDLSSMRLIISGGEPVPVSSMEDMQHRLPQCAVRQAYGMSEFPTLMLCLDPADAAQRQGSTGKANSIAEIRIVDAEGLDTEPGAVGEVICRSPATMRGYWNNPEATAAALVDGWLHTGDLATVDEAGFVYISGRSKDMIITGGLNVYPAEVERALAEHPAVIEAAVIGLPDPDWGEIGAATVVLASADAISEAELVEHLRDRLAKFKMPRRYTLSTEPLPRTTSGKVQKFKLRPTPQD